MDVHLARDLVSYILMNAFVIAGAYQHPPTHDELRNPDTYAVVAYIYTYLGLLDKLGQAKIYTKIAFWGNYNLVRIEMSEILHFKCDTDIFEYNVMPFELTNAPAITLEPFLDTFRFVNFDVPV